MYQGAATRAPVYCSALKAFVTLTDRDWQEVLPGCPELDEANVWVEDLGQEIRERCHRRLRGPALVDDRSPGGSIDPGRARHAVLGLVVLKYSSDGFEERQAALEEGRPLLPRRCVLKLRVEMLELCRGPVYDRCCGSSGMFVQWVESIPAHANGTGNGGRTRAGISIYGQGSNSRPGASPTAWLRARPPAAMSPQAPDGLEDEGEPVEGEMTRGTLYLHSRPSCPRPRRPT